MSIVYIVTEGDYSAYQIRAVFSDGDAADAYANLIGGRVEPWALDKWQAVRDHTYWRVRFGDDGQHKAYEFHPDLEDPSDIRVNVPEYASFTWSVNVIAPNEPHAIKVAAEQVAMAKGTPPERGSAQQAGIG